jgi:hypothetical protein
MLIVEARVELGSVRDGRGLATHGGLQLAAS